MSLEIIDDDVKKKHISASGSTSGRSTHEHAAQQLLYTDVQIPTGKTDKDGNPIFEAKLDVSARTELPSPANTSVLEEYGNYLEKAFGRKNRMKSLNNRYEINMISKNRKSRTEFTNVATASALNNSNENTENVLKKVQTS